MKAHTNCPRRDRRNGTAAVEFAIVAPLIILVFFGSIEFGRAMMASHSLEEAARSGCRVAVLNGATVQDVETAVNRLLDTSGMSGHTITVTPNVLSTVGQFEPITVSISTPYSSISWLPMPSFLADATIQGNSTLSKEGTLSEEPPSDDGNNGHGNDADGVDGSNPGQGQGGPNGS